ncbi:hypothetical protein [Flavobacterium agrisoli]|uniref:Uncharacterized protein n=1 Tax=Flavobacterium agrisoli TaxID=2793066 RepID=A0A934PMV1_9FLAO|nr:hypothetical protein [Flavobacterium agrisoli]MBK0371126.1 hypothetical protein [Flavobacterium agrisoli]
MDYFKNKLIISVFLIFTLLGCSTDDQPKEELEIKVTHFETSYHEVKIEWQLTKPKTIIIDDLELYRAEKNTESDFYQEVKIANLPSNEVSFIDFDVPYKKEVIYTVKINYRDESNGKLNVIRGELKSEPQSFKRDIVIFDQIPFQVEQDQLQQDVFHILFRYGSGSLQKYNSNLNTITKTKRFEAATLLNTKFQILDHNTIFLADAKGIIRNIDTESYQINNTYQVTIEDNLKAFAVAGSRIYYLDNDVWCFYNRSTGYSVNSGIIKNADYITYLGENKLLFFYTQNGNSLDIWSYTPENCPDQKNCNGTHYNSNWENFTNNAVDPNIISWNKDKTKLITSIKGGVFNFKTLKQEQRLFDSTGKHYFQCVFDDDDNIYATVQGEKSIHKFNSNYDLIEVIPTKLYPLFPLLSKEGLKVIGAYNPISYWNYEYGYGFNFNGSCGIEILK